MSIELKTGGSSEKIMSWVYVLQYGDRVLRVARDRAALAAEYQQRRQEHMHALTRTCLCQLCQNFEHPSATVLQGDEMTRETWYQQHAPQPRYHIYKVPFIEDQ